MLSRLRFLAFCLLASAIIVAGTFYLFASSANYNYCVGHNGQYEIEAQDPKGPPVVHEPISAPSFTRLVVFCGGVFAHDNGDGITAFGTVLLFLVTAILGGIAYRQFTTTRAQLRAYIALAPVEAALLADNCTIVVKVSMKNVGATPAFDFQQLGNIAIFPKGLKEHFQFKPVPEEADKARPNFVFYPTVEYPAAPRKKLSWEDLIKMDTGSFSLYVYGRVTFRDAFNREQWGEYCCVLEKSEFWDWARRAIAEPERQMVKATFKFTQGNNRASF